MKEKIKKIDIALKDTAKEYYPKLKKDKLDNLYIQLLEQLTLGNFNYITLSNNNRDNLKKIGKDNIVLELLKNIVKVNSNYKNKDDYFKTDKKITDNNLSVEEIEFIIYKEILKGHIREVLTNLKTNERLMLGLIISFVNSRYSIDAISGLDTVKDYNDLKALTAINNLENSD